MSEQKRCARCERGIDAWSRICPFCNWDQSRPAPAREAVAAPAVVYKPPPEKTLRQRVGWLGAGVIMLVLAFMVGMIINRDGAPEHAPEPITETEAEAVSVPKRADTPLVPMNEPGGFEQPITSAPVAAPEQGAVASNDWDRSDATAVSAAEYAQLAKRAQAEKRAAPKLVDPRSITGRAYTPPPQRPPSRTAAAAPAAGRTASMLRTRPVPLSQPVPRLNARGSARLDLLIGADGRVKDINVRRSINGNSAALIGAVQKWRFKPATANGQPVPAPYSVEISFRP